MARSGSENRHRAKTISFRVTAEELALLRAQAERAGVSVAALSRFAVLGERPPRASRQPTIDEQLGAKLGGQLGALASSFRAITRDMDHDELLPLMESIHRDHAEMRALWLEAFGREP